MPARFAELAWSQTLMGALSLRRRFDPVLGADVYEVKLDDEFLMSSAFTAGEVALAQLALETLQGTELDVVVGGLGLGYTARAVLDDPRVRSLTVVEALGEVIEWHEGGLFHDTAGLAADPRTSLVHGDFFAMTDTDGFYVDTPGRRVDAVIVDIDHTPRHLLHPRHATFYTPAGLSRVALRLHPGGVFTLWSDEPPDASFHAVLAEVFAVAEARVVTFANPYTGGQSANTVYLATTER